MTGQEREAEVQRLLQLPYHRGIYGDPVDGYMGQVAELPGCFTSGDTPAETLTNLEEAVAARIESCLISGDPVPGPAKALAPVA